MTHDNQKLALLTGAAGVLGRETARGLAADGYRVIMVDLDGKNVDDVVENWINDNKSTWQKWTTCN